MLKIIKNYFWNITSIIIIIAIAESVYFYNKINRSEVFRTIQQSKVKLICKVQVQYPDLFEKNFCTALNTIIVPPLNSYTYSFYSLDEENEIHDYKVTNSNVTYSIKFKIENNEKIIKFNEKDLETYISNIVYDYFNKLISQEINHYIYLINRLEFTNFISKKFKKEYYKQLKKEFPDQDINPFVNEDEKRLLSNLKNQNIKEIKSYIEIMENIDLNEIIDINFEYNLKKEYVKSKFDRLNYFNVLLISLLLGIYLNIIVIALTQNNLLKN